MIVAIEQAFEPILPLEIIVKLGRRLRSVGWRTLRMGRSGSVLRVIGISLLSRPIVVCGTVQDSKVSGCLEKRDDLRLKQPENLTA